MTPAMLKRLAPMALVVVGAAALLAPPAAAAPSWLPARASAGALRAHARARRRLLRLAADWAGALKER